ncbi:MAG: DNA methyltransferase [Armatimonadota bacterium]
MPKRRRENRLNDLSPTEWIRFQKSWFIHNPPRREEGVMLHPAKFPESLVQQFIEFFTKRGETVLDPMVGTGSTLVACLVSKRRGIGVELQEKYARVAERRIRQMRQQLRLSLGDDEAGECADEPDIRVVCADARDLDRLDIGPVQYCITSPPYWDMLRRDGFETQRERRQEGLDVAYSDDAADLGNLEDYDEFLNQLCDIYAKVYGLLEDRRYLTVIVKNVKKGGKIYPLAWDLGKRLGELFALKDERIWCQDNQRLAPYGMFNAWVSNTMHHYCLQFRKE